MPSPVILARTNVAFSRPDYQNLQIDPQAPEAQGLYVAGAVPVANRMPIAAFTLRNADKSTYNWPITYICPLGNPPDATVGSFARASGTATKYTVALNPPPPSTNNSTLAIWVRRRGALTAGQFIASLAATVGIQIGTDASTPLLYTWGNGAVTTATGLIQPLDEWALVVGTHTGANSFTYLFAPGIALQSASYADSNVVRVVSSVAAGGTGATSQTADYADLAFWARAFTPQEVLALWDPATRWRRYYVPKTYWQFGDTPVADTQPLAAQPPRPRYIRLNTFSPQANGLFAWMPVIDGTFVQTNTPGFSRLNQEPILTNVPNQIVPRARRTENNPGPDATLGVPPSAPSDFGLAALSFQTIDSNGKRQQLCFNANVDISAQTTLTFVYWIFPFQSNVTEAGYWQTNNTGSFSINTGVTFTGPQTLSFETDPHIPGRWQMMTVARTLSRITVWRDQTLIGTVNAAGTAVDAQEFFPEFIIAKGVNPATAGVNALWADFRIYNREWTQGDVNYAYNPATRWDYYYKPKTTPYEDIPIIPPPGSGFLSRLALMGAG